MTSLDVVQGYLSKRKQRPEVDFRCDSWEVILSGVPQSPTLVLFCSINLCVTCS